LVEPQPRAGEPVFVARHLTVQSRIFNMKTFLTLAAAIAALTTASAGFAKAPAGGHWEWQSRPSHGPNKSSFPLRVRVWIKDGGSEVADCNCAMMKMSAADCMMDMPGKHGVPSAS
jgi:hypothetical protein